MSANMTDINEYRRWKRAKQAWQAANPGKLWSRLSEADRLAYRRGLEALEARVRKNHPSRG